MSDRTCSRCSLTKPASEFSKQCCKLCHNERMRDYRAANRGKIKEIARRCYEKNREVRIANARTYAELNPPDPERRRANGRARYAADRDRARTVKRAWRDANPEVFREKNRRGASQRRALRRALPVERYDLAEIIERDGTRCVLCDEELDANATWPDLRATTIEHLECLAWPGSPGDVLSNVAAAHFSCNNRRRTNPHPAAAAKRAALVVLYAVTHTS